MTRDKVFISYSHRDKRWLVRLQKMLKPLVRRDTISLWADTEIKPGANWRGEIESALASARVAVLLVSAEFLASDFIVEQELSPLLRAAEDEGVTILWVYLSPCHYEETPIGAYQAAFDVEESLIELTFPKQQRALLEISRRIKEAAEKALPVSTGSVPLERLSERHEVLTLPDRGDGIARVLSLHLGPTTVIGRCYASQLRHAARGALEGMGEDRVHWVLAWDDDRLSQLMVRLRYRTIDEGDNVVEVQNIAGYSSRKQSFSITGEASVGRKIETGETIDVAMRPGVALTLTSGVGSGRQQLVQWVADVISLGDTRVPVFRTTATTFLFPPTGLETTLVRYLGAWIPTGYEDLLAVLSGGTPIAVRFMRDDLDLEIASLEGRLRVRSTNMDLSQLLNMEENAGT